jgi:hypothetical protein
MKPFWKMTKDEKKKHERSQALKLDTLLVKAQDLARDLSDLHFAPVTPYDRVRGKIEEARRTVFAHLDKL